MGIIRDGEDIMDAVSDAILHNDYSHLSDAINDTVNDVTDTINDVTDAISGGFDRYHRDDRHYRDDRYYRDGTGKASYSDEGPHRASSGWYRYRYGESAYGSHTQDPHTQEVEPRTAFSMSRVGGSTGLGRLIGGICLGLFIGWPFLLGGIAIVVEDIGIALMGIVIGLVFSIPSAWLIATGAKKRALAKRFSEYKGYAGNNEYLDIGKLARYTGESKEKTLANLRQMMKNGWLPGAWIDPSETTLILTERAYQQYQQAQESFRQRQEEARAHAQQNEGAAGEGQQKDAGYTEEVQKILSDGEKYRAEIHHANDLISDAAMSAKLAQLETLLDRIFSQVRKKPEAAKDLHRLMNYYLPTTMKLVDAYIELDAQPDAGENIRKTKREIEDALDTINAAFEKLLDSLFQDMAWDIESDIDVMETMFQRDGLTEDELHKSAKQEKTQEEDRDASAGPDASKKTWSQMKEEAGIRDRDEENSRRG